MPHNSPEIPESIILPVATAAASMIGYIAKYLHAGKPKSWKRVLGGVLIAGLVGAGVAILLSEMNFPPGVVGFVAGALGSQGPAVEDLIVDKAKSLFK